MGKPLSVAFTADIDPDANRARAGRVDAVSAGAREAGFDACFRGLRLFLDLLEENSLPATLFWEGRTLEQLAHRQADLMARVRQNESLEHGCHGYRHEDFAGQVSGIPLGRARTRAILAQAGEVLGSALGAAPAGFRAPYCRLTPDLTGALVEEGYAYDASLAREPSAAWGLRPYRLEGAPALWELALCRSKDRQGKAISGYLWQLFEGRRPVEDYVELVGSLRQECSGGLLQVALHPWHLVVSEDGRPPASDGTANPADRLRQFVERVLGIDGLAFTTAGAYLQEACRPDGQ